MSQTAPSYAGGGRGGRGGGGEMHPQYHPQLNQTISADSSQYACYNRGKFPPPYRTRIYNEEAFDALLTHSSLDKSTKSLPSTLNPRPGSKAAKAAAARALKEAEQTKKDRRYQLYREDMARKQQDTKRLLQERLAERQESQEARFHGLCSSLTAGSGFVEQLSKNLDMGEAAEKNKKLKQYQEWNENVFGAIQGRITEGINKEGYRAINARRCGYMDEFIDITNKKAAIFRDIIIESDYDPLKPNRHCVNARPAPGSLRDPTSRVLDKYNEETNMLSGGGGTKETKMRHTLDTKQWATGVIESTPHGFFSKMMAKSDKNDKNKNKNKSNMAGKPSLTYQSSVHLDDFDAPQGRDVVTKEFPRGKKTFAAGDDYELRKLA